MDHLNNASSTINAIHTTLAKIMNFKDEWYTLSDDYQVRVEILYSQLDRCEELFRLHKLRADSVPMKILKKAENTLKRVDARLDGLENLTKGDQCCSQMKIWYAKLIIVLFPANIEKTVKNVEEDIENIVKALKKERELIAQLQEERKRKAISKMVDNNGLYVPIKDVESAVIEAINDWEGQKLILLHGGAGKGKSTLAKRIYCIYGEDRENGNRTDKETENPFERLPILVSCAKCSKDDISAKQFQILQEHSPDSLGDLKPKDQGSPDSRIAEALRLFLGEKKFLIILDDVTNKEFLHGMCSSTSGDGRDVKYLVTSQDSNICTFGEPERIAMDKPTEDEARNILGSLVRLGPIIPTELQPTADKIIEALERNPLALACFASQFKNTVNKKNWNDAYKGLEKVLKRKDEKFVLGSTPRSLGAAFESCINNLDSPEARKILFLVYACKAEAVHEAILEILYASFEESSCLFFTLKDELVMKELLKPAVNPKEKDENDGESTVWSLGSLAKLFIKYWVDEKGNRYEKDMRSMIGELVGDEELAPKSTVKHCRDASEAQRREMSQKARVTIVLCALYFDQGNVEAYEIVTKAMTRANIPYSNDNFNDLRRQAIEPMVWLLGKQEEGEEGSWKGEDICCVQKVLLAYLCDGQLDGKNISHLLKLKSSPVAQLTTLKAIEDICYIEDNHLFTENNLDFLQAMLQLMESNERLPTYSVQKAASRTLHAVCWKAAQEQSSPLIVDAPGVLDVLISAISRPTNWSAVRAAYALLSLAYTSPANRLKIIDKQGALVSLVKCLFEHNQPDLQAAAAGALRNLASSEDMISRIMNQDGALDGLVKCLFEHNQPDLQAAAAGALRNLACSEAMISRIMNQDGALDGLVKCLFEHNQPDLQAAAAGALSNLTRSEDMISRIMNQDGALDGLVKCLFEHNQPDLQAAAAGALSNLARSEDMISRIMNQDGALDGLVKCLPVHDKPKVQENALLSLAKLATSTESIRIAQQEGALTCIEKCLAAQGHPTVQCGAARLLWNLATFAEVNTILKETDGLVKGLSGLLAERIPPASSLYASTHFLGARALTLIDPTLAKGASLTSADAYSGRGYALVFMGMDVEALPDLDQAVDLQQVASSIPFRRRCFVRAQLGNLEGALDDANEAVKLGESENDLHFFFQERGVLKRMKGDLDGALADLDEGLKLKTEDYEILKHRGFVKFLLNDEEGARADADWALRIKRSSRYRCLGTTPVEYLGYKLQ